MSEFRWYRKTALQPMRPYVPGEDLSDVCVPMGSAVEAGGMIAVNPDAADDLWYVSKEFFEANYKLATPQSEADEEYGLWYASRLTETHDAAVNPGTLSFGHAVAALKQGKKVARAGWNGKGMWLELVKSNEYTVSYHNIPFTARDAQAGDLLPFIMMKTADNKFVPWLASQTDVLADDWSVV